MSSEHTYIFSIDSSEVGEAAVLSCKSYQRSLFQICHQSQTGAGCVPSCEDGMTTFRR